MQGNKSRDTKPEMMVRQALRAAGLRGYRVDWKKAPGKPDIAFVGKKVAVMVHGCFWHRCPYCQPSSPRKNSEFWQRKFLRNQERDARKERELREAGWRVVSLWECRILADIEECVAEVCVVLGHLTEPR